MIARVPLSLCCLLAGAAVLRAANDVPQWVHDAAAVPVKAYSPKVEMVEVLEEEQLTVDPEGKRLMRERGVIRILQRTSNKVMAYRTYNTKSGRIRDFQGWLLPPSGKPTIFGKNQVVDQSLSAGYSYEEARARVLDAGNLEPGSIFAYEIVEEEKTVFTQYQYRFQGSSPVIVSRFILSLPDGWEASGTVYNHENLQASVAQNTYTWELRDLPWIEREDHSPGLHALAPRVGVSYFPSAGNRAGLRPLKDWPSVSAWLSEFVDPPAEVTESVRTQAAELAKGAKTDLEKIQAVAAFAQKTNYVSVDLNVSRGGGYTPHRAADVMARNYGDCKDKATLMRALLKPLGIESYLTVIYSGDRQYVRPEWPSPHVFNHAIIAIQVPGTLKLPTAFNHPRLGRLLIFDPTDPDTPVGDLPTEEQGSNALIIVGDKGELVTMPLLPAETSRIESAVDAQLDVHGHLAAHVVRDYFGQDATYVRASIRRRNPDDFKKAFEVGLSRRLGGLTLKEFMPSDIAAEGRAQLRMDLAVGRFGQMMQNRLLIIHPGSLVPGQGYGFVARERKAPVRLSANVRKDAVSIKLPEGFTIDESPAPMSLETPYGVYHASWKSKGSELIFEQSLEVKDILVPAADYAKVRDFFEKIAGGQYSPVVLVK